MSILEGAYWISSQNHKKYLKANNDGTVHGVDPGPRGLEILDSTALRARIWLIEKATDGKYFRLRNYETGCALDVNDKTLDDESPVVASRGSTDSQLWDINILEGSAESSTYQIISAFTSTTLHQIGSNESYFTIASSLLESLSDQGWLVEPVMLSELYRITSISPPGMILYAPDFPNASDGISGEVALSDAREGPNHSVRSRLWAFEYTSLNECLIRSALSHQFALSLAPNHRSVMVLKYRGEMSQRWVVKDKDVKKHIINLTSARTGTLLTSETHQTFNGQSLYALTTALSGNIDWEIQTGPQAPLFWVTIQHKSGGFLAQANNRAVIFSQGALYPNDYSCQWRFIMVGNDLRYVIMNRATGFVLGFDYTAGLTVTTYSTVANGEDGGNVNNHWILDISGNNYAAVLHVESKYALCSDACNYYSVGSDASSWIIAAAHDALPSFALINPYTGRCLANNLDPEAGTVSTVDEINDTTSQWLFYEPTPGPSSNPDPRYFLLNKMTGAALERFVANDRVEAHAYYNPTYNPGATASQAWQIVPLAGRMVSLFVTRGRTDNYGRYRYYQSFLNDASQYGPKTEASWRADQNPCWYLVSHREAGFDLISLDLDIMKRLMTHVTGQNVYVLKNLMAAYQSANECMEKGSSKSTHIPSTSRSTRAIHDNLRVILAHLVRQFAEDFISQAREPCPILSITRGTIEQQWDIILSQRSLRRRSEEPGWARIDLKGIYDVGGSWKANIVGMWLDTPMFQVIIPADIHIGRAVIRRAMLQSLNQMLTVDVQETPSEPTILPEITRPGIIDLDNPFRPGLGGGEEGANSLILTLSSVPISYLKHNEL